MERGVKHHKPYPYPLTFPNAIYLHTLKKKILSMFSSWVELKYYFDVSKHQLISHLFSIAQLKLICLRSEYVIYDDVTLVSSTSTVYLLPTMSKLSIHTLHWVHLNLVHAWYFSQSVNKITLNVFSWYVRTLGGGASWTWSYGS